MSDGNSLMRCPTDITDMTLKMRKCDFGVCMCELEQQPNETRKMDIGWKIGKLHYSELLLK